VQAPIGHNSQQDTVIDSLIKRISKLPGLGSRSARRIVLHLLRHPEQALAPLITQLQEVAADVQTCEQCRNLDVSSPCHICMDTSRDEQLICVVEDVADVWALERSGLYRGYYHVLGGVLSALSGKDPETLGIPDLIGRARQDNVREVILATSSTADGQTTAHYISDHLQQENVRLTRLAQGIPVGGELDYIDDGTLGAALQARLAV
jgi:recombination protein RecR